METPEMQQLIVKNLHPDTDTLLGLQSSAPYLVDLEAIVDLVNHIQSDPVRASNLLLKYLMVVKNLYSTAKHDFDKTRNRKDELHTELYKLYGSQDDSNPYYKKAKLTGAFIEAAVSESPEYKELVLKTIDLDNLCIRLYHIKDVLEQEFDLVKILIQKYDTIPLSGQVLSPEVMQKKIEEFSQNMVFKSVPEPKKHNKNFESVEYDEDEDF